MKNRKGLILLIAAAIGLVIALLPTSDALNRPALIFLGVFVWFLISASVEAVSLHVGLLTILVVMVVTNSTDFETAFAAFGQTTPWLIFGVLAFGAAIQSTGLFTRLSLHVMRIFPNTFRGQVSALTLASAALGPAIPSVMAKTSLLASVAVPMAESAGYEKNSKQSVGIFAAFFLPVVFYSNMWLTGSEGVPMMLGLLPGEEFSFVRWLSFTWVFGLVFLGLAYVAILVYYGPKKGETGYEAGDGPNPAIEKLAALGPMTKNERLAAVIFVATILLWITESFHGISTTVVTLCAVLALTFAGIFSASDYGTKIPWLIIVMVGAVLGVASLMTSTGVTAWVGDVVAPLLGPVGTNIWLLVPVVFIATFLLRYVVVSMSATMLIMFAIFAGEASAAGIHPIVVIFTSLMASNCWQTPFNNAVYIATGAQVASIGEYKYLRSTTYIASAVALVACMASIPVWSALPV